MGRFQQALSSQQKPNPAIYVSALSAEEREELRVLVEERGIGRYRLMAIINDLEDFEVGSNWTYSLINIIKKGNA